MSHTTICRRKRRSMSQMNVVPYIDVMLVLLVIFMVTAPMMQAGVEVDAPEASAEPLTSDNQQEPLTISVDKAGQIFLDDGSETSNEGITQYLTGKLGDKGDRPVYIKADKTAEYHYLVGAMVAAQQAGAKKISLVVDAAPTPDKP